MNKPRSGFSYYSDRQLAEYASVLDRADETTWNLEGEVLEHRRVQLAKAEESEATRGGQFATNHQIAANRFYYVQRVIDGDTMEIDGATIRLLNIDTPERGQYGYDMATTELRNLVEGRSVKLEFADSSEATRDRFNRVLAFVFVDDQFVNYEMIRSGWTNFYTDYGPGRYARALTYAESEAKRFSRGLHR